MTTESILTKLTHSGEGMRLFQQERAIIEITELVCQIMEEEGVSRSDLAERLGRSKGYVTQLLDGRANMTVRTISDVLVVLGKSIHFQERPLEKSVSADPEIRLCVPVQWSSCDRQWPETLLDLDTPNPVRGRLAS